MANRVVSVSKRIKTDKGLRFVPVVRNANGRIKQDIVLVQGNEEKHSEGSYYICWLDGRKLRREAVGRDATLAYNAQLAKQEALANGTANGNSTPTPEQSSSRTLAEAIEAYLAEVKITKKPKTYAAYSKALAYFEESAGGSTPLAQINRTHLINFRGFLGDEKELSARSVYNKFESVISFLGNQGMVVLRQNKKGKMTVAGISKEDWPSFVEEVPEIYEREEIDQLFAAATPEERLWFQFFLMTGMREQEVMYAYWSDLNLAHATVHVKHKPDRNWTPKAYKEREIPIPAVLVDALRSHKAKSDRKCNLIFPTAGCNPKLDFLDCLKRVAKRANLTCRVKLHKFRATFATWHLWAGTDIRTVQAWMGHSDLESTMRYLKPNRTQAVREKVNVAFGGM